MSKTKEAQIKAIQTEMDDIAEEDAKLSAKLRELRTRERELYIKLVELKLGVAPGVIVAANGKRFRVVAVDLRHSTIESELRFKPWITANPELKGGGFGKAERHLYGNWTVVQGEESQ